MPAAVVTATADGDVSLPATAADTEGNGRVYLVRQGDTLWDVAQKAGVSVTALAKANHRSSRSVLRPGTTLTLPELGGK